MSGKIPNEDLNRLGVDEFRSAKKMPVHVVLDNVRSAQNVGSIFRSMDAFRCKKIHLCGISAVPPNREINKTALGATHTVEWQYHETTAEAVKSLQSTGVKVYAVEQVEGSRALGDFTWSFDREVALVFGNEVEGVGEEVVAAANGFIEIEQFGTKHSLNIAVCCGIVLWHLSQSFDFSAH